MKSLVLLLTFLPAVLFGVAEFPGEPCTREPVTFAPFPDALSAYVWRNWFLVPKDVLARAIGATQSEVTETAEELGLPPEPHVQPEWRRRGYVTVLKRNWHLLPYEQLFKVLDMTRDELLFAFKEEDFLFYKLGDLKPKCALVVWRKSDDGLRVARRRLARVLEEEGVDVAAAESPRFGFFSEFANVPAGMHRQAAIGNGALRIVYPYTGTYCDSLEDPEVSSYPEGLLARLAGEGVNGIWLHAVLWTLAKDPKYPEFGNGCENRLANLRVLVARAAKYGIKVFLYMNEPRGQLGSFFEVDPARRDMKGSPYGPQGFEQYAFCTSSPETRRWLEDSLAQVFASVPGLGGIITITYSENLTHCASRWKRESCPRCRMRSDADLIVEANSAMIAGVHRSAPDAQVLVWDWAWPTNAAKDVISRLPKRNVKLLCGSESRMKFRRGGVYVEERDYAISVVGPGRQALERWSLAADAGLGLAAKVQAANSLELASYPYYPTLEQVARHACNLRAARVDSILLSWSIDTYPCAAFRIFELADRTGLSPDGLLDRLAAEQYGSAAAPTVRRAWRAFSEGFASFPHNISTLYSDPQHMGPANPLYLEPTGYRATMNFFPYDDVVSWCGVYPPDTWVWLMQNVANGFAEGCRIFEEAIPMMEADKRAEARRELDLFCGERIHFQSAADQMRFTLARDKRLKAKSAADRARLTGEMAEAVRRELAAAKELLPIVERDSRIGFIPSVRYYFVPQDLREKVLLCRTLLDELR